jgi:hypothetical protein
MIIMRNVSTESHTPYFAFGLLMLLSFTNAPMMNAGNIFANSSDNSGPFTVASQMSTSNMTSTSTTTSSSFPVYYPQTSFAWPCGKGLPSGSAVNPKGNYAGEYIAESYAVLPNSTQVSLPYCAGIAALNTTSYQTYDYATTGLGDSPSYSNLTSGYCTTSTTCSLSSVSVTAGDVIVVAAQVPSGSISVSDSGNTWTTVDTDDDTSGDIVGVFYATASSTGSDTIEIHGSVSGTMAGEVYQVSGLSAGWSTSYSATQCTSLCMSSISTGALSFTQPSFLIGSVFASPGSSSSSHGSNFRLTIAHSNSLDAAEIGVSEPYGMTPGDPNTFALTDGSTPSNWVDLGVAFQEPAFKSLEGTWTVPPAPTGTSGWAEGLQFVDIFPGFENTTLNDIVQPVILYGCLVFAGVPPSCIDGGAKWTMYAYELGFTGSPMFGGPTTVSAGNSITGSLTWDATHSSCASSGPAFEIYIEDTTTSNSQTYYQCTTLGLRQVIGAALEASTNISSCNYMPDETSLTFSSLTISMFGTFSASGEGIHKGCGTGASWGATIDSGSPTIDWTDT